ncbi:MAG: hypothetical protein ACJ739_14315 [Acidimicrobiales bacterium]
MAEPAELTAGTGLAEMDRWVAWVVRLTAHTAEQATDRATREWLRGAHEDAASLREVLRAAAQGQLDAREVEIARSVYELWDANHDRTERLAAAVDRVWYAEWRQRSAGARPHVATSNDELPLLTVA